MSEALERGGVLVERLVCVRARVVERVFFCPEPLPSLPFAAAASA
jgi:hypothetical protein